MKTTIHLSIFKILTVFAMCAGVVNLTGCVDAGGKQLSLLPSSQLLDPLETPPGLSPLPEADQLQLPEEFDESQIDYASLPPEQFRNYESWVSFEKFREYKANQEAEQLDVEQYRDAKAKGEGQFRVQVELRADESIRLRIVDSMDAVWNRLTLVLNDLDVGVRQSDYEKGIFYVLNIFTKEKPTLSERMGFKEYRGRIDELHVVSSEDGQLTYVIPMTVDGGTVKASAARDFITRVRYYLLTHYQVNDTENLTQIASVNNARYQNDDNGDRFVEISQDFNSTWVHLGRTLEASGVNIDDLNRSEGLYIVSFRSAEKVNKKRWWAFWRSKDDRDIQDQQFNVTVTESGENTQIRVRPADEEDESNVIAAEGLLEVIYERIDS